MQRQQYGLLQRPAEPSRRQAKRPTAAGTTIISRGIDVPRQYRADAVVERIAGREHANRPAAMA